jgi:uncharacterized protein YqfB (UPF0267 family)
MRKILGEIAELKKMNEVQLKKYAKQERLELKLLNKAIQEVLPQLQEN